MAEYRGGKVPNKPSDSTKSAGLKQTGAKTAAGDKRKLSPREKMMRRRRRRVRINRTIFGIVLAVVLVYFVGVLFYSRHFYSNASVFGVSVKNQSAASLKQAVSEKVNGYQLQLSTRDGDRTLDAADFDMTFNDQGEIDDLLSQQNPFLWVAMGKTPEEDISISVLFTEAKLRTAIQSLDIMETMNMTAPTNAYIQYDEASNSFSIQEDTAGNQLDANATYQAISSAINSGEFSLDLDAAGCYVKPAIAADDAALVAECEDVNKIANMTITYDFSDRSETLEGSTIATWLTFNDDCTYNIDDTDAANFIAGLAKKYDTMGQTRSFTTHYGNTITLKGGDYGWCINKSASAQALFAYIRACEDCTVEPEYLWSGVCRDTNDIGGNYVEVSIADQCMWVYKNGTCVVATDVVTGCVLYETETPSGGVWAVDAKTKDYTLVGQDYDSEVSYWLPFNGNVGIHDATWRDEFGGDIYKTNGSHGCVNTPLSAMKEVYANVEIGYPVVVY